MYHPAAHLNPMLEYCHSQFPTENFGVKHAGCILIVWLRGMAKPRPRHFLNRSLTGPAVAPQMLVPSRCCDCSHPVNGRTRRSLDASIRQNQTHQKQHSPRQTDNHNCAQNVKSGLRCSIPGANRSQDIVEATSVGFAEDCFHQFMREHRGRTTMEPGLGKIYGVFTLVPL